MKGEIEQERANESANEAGILDRTGQDDFVLETTGVNLREQFDLPIRPGKVEQYDMNFIRVSVLKPEFLENGALHPFGRDGDELRAQLKEIGRVRIDAAWDVFNV